MMIIMIMIMMIITISNDYDITQKMARGFPTRTCFGKDWIVSYQW